MSCRPACRARSSHARRASRGGAAYGPHPEEGAWRPFRRMAPHSMPCFETPPSAAPQHEDGLDCADARRSFFLAGVFRFEIALNLRCSQNLLDPFCFVESFVDVKSKIRSKF